MRHFCPLYSLKKVFFANRRATLFMFKSLRHTILRSVSACTDYSNHVNETFTGLLYLLSFLFTVNSTTFSHRQLPRATKRDATWLILSQKDDLNVMQVSSRLKISDSSLTLSPSKGIITSTVRELCYLSVWNKLIQVSRVFLRKTPYFFGCAFRWWLLFASLREHGEERFYYRWKRSRRRSAQCHSNGIMIYTILCAPTVRIMERKRSSIWEA